MSPETDIDILISRYVSGDASEQECDQLRQHMERDLSMVRRVYDAATQVREMRAVLASAGAVRRSWWRTARVPMAAAAALVAAAGLFALYWGGSKEIGPGSTCAMGTITKTVGQVSVVDRPMANGAATEIRTGADSLCRLDQPDGSVVAVDRNTRLTLERHDAGNRRLLDLESGRVYLDVAPQESPFLIQAGSVKAQILGTRILVTRLGIPSIAVLDGRVHVSNGDSSTIAVGGQTAAPVPAQGGRDGALISGFSAESGNTNWAESFDVQLGDGLGKSNSPSLPKGRTAVPVRAPGKKDGLLVSTLPVKPEQLNWADCLGIDSESLLRSLPALPPGPGGSSLNWRHYRIYGGDWDMMSLVQNSLAPALLQIGEPVWTKGVYTCRFKVLRTSDSGGAYVAPTFGNSEAGPMQSLGFKDLLAPLIAQGAAICYRTTFEMDPADHTLRNLRVEMWSERNPREVWQAEATPISSGKGKADRTGPCAVGVTTENCAVKFLDFDLKQGVQAVPSARQEKK